MKICIFTITLGWVLELQKKQPSSQIKFCTSFLVEWNAKRTYNNTSKFPKFDQVPSKNHKGVKMDLLGAFLSKTQLFAV